MRVGVIGLGVISRFYLAALGHVGTGHPGPSAPCPDGALAIDPVEPLADGCPEPVLAAVCDVRPEAMAPFRGEVPCWTDHRDLLAAGGIDAVVVTVPNDLHAPVCRDALAAGVAVCVEKPLAIRLDDGLALADLAATRDTVLFTSFHRRYNARVRELRAGLPRGVPVTSVRVRYLERIEEHVGEDRWYLDPRRCGGGCVADNGPNAFDLAALFLGPLDVTAVDVRRDRAGIDRQAMVRLASASGAHAAVELDWSHRGETKDVEVRLADGTVRHADLLAGFPGFKRSLWHEYAGVLRDFTRAVHDPAGAGDRDNGVAALRAVDATYRAEHRARVAPIGHRRRR